MGQKSMFTKMIGLQRWADIHAESVIVTRHETGALLSTIGVHPALRSFTAIQGTGNQVTLVSECALPLDITRH
jgi:hypothetical protein